MRDFFNGCIGEAGFFASFSFDNHKMAASFPDKGPAIFAFLTPLVALMQACSDMMPTSLPNQTTYIDGCDDCCRVADDADDDTYCLYRASASARVVKTS